MLCAAVKSTQPLAFLKVTWLKMAKGIFKHDWSFSD